MQAFGLIFTHYMKRNLRDWQNYLLIVLPLAFIVLNLLVAEWDVATLGGYNMVATVTSMMMMLGFQFFASGTLLHWLFTDFDGDVHWRLSMAPVRQTTFFMSVVVSNLVFAMLQGLLIVAVTALAFDAYWGNGFVTAAVILLTALAVQFCAILIFNLTKKKSTGDGLTYVLGFGLLAMNNAFGDLGLDFLADYNPVGLGMRAILQSGELDGHFGFLSTVTNPLLLLTVWTVVLGVLAFVVKKK